MRLLITASSFAHVCSFHLPYIEGFHKLGWEIDIACGGAIREIPLADRLISLPMEKRMLSASNLKAAVKLRREIKSRSYDLIIMHTSLAAFFTRLAFCGIKGRPHSINLVHGYLFDDRTRTPKARLLKAAELFMAPATDLVLTMNDYDYSWAKKHRVAHRVSFIPGLGADERRIDGSVVKDYGFGENAFVLVFPAEFSARKNQTLLISAMARLPDSVRLVLPGDGELLEECKRQAQSLGVSGRVCFPGYVDDIIPWLKGADAAISSSRTEGLPFNIIEAMQCGLPVIASRVKGNSDLVEDGITGLLYDYGSVEGCAAAVKTLLHHPSLCASMGLNGQKKAGDYGLETVYPQVMKEYLNWSKYD